MTKNEIVESIYRANMLRDIIRTIGKTELRHNLQDLEMDLYEEILNMDEGLLQRLYNSNQLRFYLTRLVMNNIRSKTSRYYYTYKKTIIDDNVQLEDLENDKEKKRN